MVGDARPAHRVARLHGELRAVGHRRRRRPGADREPCAGRGSRATRAGTRSCRERLFAAGASRAAGGPARDIPRRAADRRAAASPTCVARRGRALDGAPTLRRGIEHQRVDGDREEEQAQVADRVLVEADRAGRRRLLGRAAPPQAVGLPQEDRAEDDRGDEVDQRPSGRRRTGPARSRPSGPCRAPIWRVVSGMPLTTGSIGTPAAA